MRCRSCNVVLNEFEMTRRYKREDPNDLDYVELCNNCFDTIKDDVNVVERKDLKDESLEDESDL